MSSISSCSRTALVACLIAAAGTVGIAVERMPLPAFTLIRGDATTVTSERLAQSGGWILIYVAPQCAPCQAILRSLDGKENPSLAGRVVIVVAGATPETVREEAARYPGLADATWLGDSTGAIPQAIAGTTVPTIVGVQGKTIEWSLAGVLMDPADARTVVVNWLSRSTAF